LHDDGSLFFHGVPDVYVEKYPVRDGAIFDGSVD
jgi:hypothetical protein